MTTGADLGVDPRLQRRAIAVVVTMLIIEGAFRKWIPGTGQPLYVLRDVVTLGFVLSLSSAGATTKRAGAFIGCYVFAFTLLSVIQALLVSDSTIALALGLKSYVAPALILLMVLQCSPRLALDTATAVVCWLAPVQLLITVVQVTSPASAFVNRQLGEEAAYFTTAGGVVRASGTFSAPIGLALFATSCFALALAAVAERRARRVAYVALFCCVLIAAIGGARSTVFYIGMLVVLTLVVALWRSPTGPRTVLTIAAIGGGSALLAFAAFPSVVDAFTTRFQTAAASESLFDRVTDGPRGALGYDFSLLGDGMGVHSTAGIAAGAAGPWIEDDLPRMVAELGFLGVIIVLIRVLVGLYLVASALFSSRFSTSYLLLAALTAITLVFGSVFTQPTVQGFAGLIAGLALAAHHLGTPSTAAVGPRMRKS